MMVHVAGSARRTMSVLGQRVRSEKLFQLTAQADLDKACAMQTADGLVVCSLRCGSSDPRNLCHGVFRRVVDRRNGEFASCTGGA